VHLTAVCRLLSATVQLQHNKNIVCQCEGKFHLLSVTKYYTCYKACSVVDCS